jgi:hypothetical protein
LSAAVPFRLVPAALGLREMKFAKILVLPSTALDKFAGFHAKKWISITLTGD